MPGWSNRVPFRDLLTYYCEHNKDSMDVIDQAQHAFANDLKKAGALYYSVSSELLNKMDELAKASTSYEQTRLV